MLLQRFWKVPLRVTSGAYILNSGLSKRHADDETVEHLHRQAANAYPFLESVPAGRFVQALSATEIVLGGALLAPFVPSRLAGIGLTAFSGGLVGMYWETPSAHLPDDPRPTAQGVGLAKDAWLVGMGLSLLIGPSGTKRKPTREKAKHEKAKRRTQRKHPEQPHARRADHASPQHGDQAHDHGHDAGTHRGVIGAGAAAAVHAARHPGVVVETVGHVAHHTPVLRHRRTAGKHRDEKHGRHRVRNGVRAAGFAVPIWHAVRRTRAHAST